MIVLLRRLLILPTGTSPDLIDRRLMSSSLECVAFRAWFRRAAVAFVGLNHTVAASTFFDHQPARWYRRSPDPACAHHHRRRASLWLDSGRLRHRLRLRHCRQVCRHGLHQSWSFLPFVRSLSPVSPPALGALSATIGLGHGLGYGWPDHLLWPIWFERIWLFYLRFRTVWWIFFDVRWF